MKLYAQCQQRHFALLEGHLGGGDCAEDSAREYLGNDYGKGAELKTGRMADVRIQKKKPPSPQAILTRMQAPNPKLLDSRDATRASSAGVSA